MSDFLIEEQRTFTLHLPSGDVLLTLEDLSDLYDAVGMALDKARGGAK